MSRHAVSAAAARRAAYAAGTPRLGWPASPLRPEERLHRLGADVVLGHEPLVVLLGQHRPEQPEDSRLVREDADHGAAPL
jgi:hypothetical protein